MPRVEGGLTRPPGPTKNNAPRPIGATTVSIRMQPGTEQIDGLDETLPLPNLNPRKDQATIPLDLRPTSQITIDIAPPSGTMPDDRSGLLVVSPINPWDYARGDSIVQYQWEVPIVCHGPLYFDDVPLEHFGQTRCRCLQFAISTVKFAGDMIILPYKMALDHPHTPTYTLRTWPRPGSPAPCVRRTIPFELKPLLVQAGVVLAIVFIFP